MSAPHAMPLAVTVYLDTDAGLLRGTLLSATPSAFFVEVRAGVAKRERLAVTFAGEDGTEMVAVCEVKGRVSRSLRLAPDVNVLGFGLSLRVVGWETGGHPARQVVERESRAH